MLKIVSSFSGFSVDNLETAKEFYTSILGLEVASEDMGLQLKLPAGGMVFIYAKDDHAPASYTMLNFVVEDIDAAIDELVNEGIQMERYEGMEQDEKGVLRGQAQNLGPDIAWFKDPAGNILSVIQK